MTLLASMSDAHVHTTAYQEGEANDDHPPIPFAAAQGDVMPTFREMSEASTMRWMDGLRSQGRKVSHKAEATMVEADCVDVATELIGDPRWIPYAGDTDLKRLRRDAYLALQALDQELYTRAFALLDNNVKSGQ